ncbi:MAG: DUF4340 domain-containing protein [Hyphomonadaceae bacterium]
MKLTRSTKLVWWWAVAGLALLLAVAAGWPSSTRGASDEGKAVFPALGGQAGEIALIMVTTREGAYHLVKDPGGWVLTEMHRYPVRDDRIAELVSATASMRRAQTMTRDPRKLDALGLGDPARAGTGALVEIGNGQGDVFATFIAGYKSGRNFIRTPDDLQAWEVTGDPMPPLHSPARWLDLDVARIAAADIDAVDVQPVSGPSYSLVRDERGGWTLDQPFETRGERSASAFETVAQTLSRWSPNDVVPLDELEGALGAGSQSATTRDGLRVRVDFMRDRKGASWARVTAASSDGAAGSKQAASALNARAAGWAYRIPDSEITLGAPPLSVIASAD